MSKKKPSPEVTNPINNSLPEPKKEIGGFENKPEPTRYGDWEVGGRCSDF